MESGDRDRDVRDALSKLLQIGSVVEYQSVFKDLISRVTGISESLLSSFYISGLKLKLQLELLRSYSRPTTLEEAFYLARITEARLEEIAEKERPQVSPEVATEVAPDVALEVAPEDVGFDPDKEPVDLVGESHLVFCESQHVFGRSQPFLAESQFVGESRLARVVTTSPFDFGFGESQPFVSSEWKDCKRGIPPSTRVGEQVEMDNANVSASYKIWDPGIMIVFQEVTLRAR